MGPTSPQKRESRLVEAFVELADTFVKDFDVADMLHQLTEYCVELLDASTAGLMLADQRGSMHVMATSHEKTWVLELFQLQVNEGPCLDAFHTGEPVSIPNIDAMSDRWPAFAPEAARNDVASVHAVPMRLHDDTIGALNLFGARVGTISDADLRVARGLADIATIGILSERSLTRHEALTEQLQTALNSRVTIEQAKGVLAQAGDVTMDKAFAMLRAYARAHSIRLSDVAYRVVTRDLVPTDILEHRPAR